MSTEKKDKRFNNIINNLTSVSNKDVFTAIKQLRKYGKAEAIPHLFYLYKKTEDKEIKDNLISFLFDLKDQSTTPKIIELIAEEDNHEDKAFLISIFWQSSLDASEHLSFLVTQAISGNYMVCLEVLTIIDNIESTYQEEEIMNLEYDIHEALESETEEKKQLLISLNNAIKSLNIEY
jgi:hypothetical protein